MSSVPAASLGAAWGAPPLVVEEAAEAAPSASVSRAGPEAGSGVSESGDSDTPLVL